MEKWHFSIIYQYLIYMAQIIMYVSKITYVLNSVILNDICACEELTVCLWTKILSLNIARRLHLQRISRQSYYSRSTQDSSGFTDVRGRGRQGSETRIRNFRESDGSSVTETMNARSDNGSQSGGRAGVWVNRFDYPVQRRSRLCKSRASVSLGCTKILHSRRARCVFRLAAIV